MWCNARPVSRLFGAASKAGGASSVVGWPNPQISKPVLCSTPLAARMPRDQINGSNSLCHAVLQKACGQTFALAACCRHCARHARNYHHIEDAPATRAAW